MFFVSISSLFLNSAKTVVYSTVPLLKIYNSKNWKCSIIYWNMGLCYIIIYNILNTKIIKKSSILSKHENNG